MAGNHRFAEPASMVRPMQTPWSLGLISVWHRVSRARHGIQCAKSRLSAVLNPFRLNQSVPIAAPTPPSANAVLACDAAVVRYL